MGATPRWGATPCCARRLLPEQVRARNRLGHAVVRNRIRRRLREIYRPHREELRPGADMVVVARGRSVGAAYRELERDFLAGCRKLSILREEAAP